MNEEHAPSRCFMDGIDWQYHLDGDSGGTKLYPSEKALRADKMCVNIGGCGVVEVEVRFVRWVEPQDIKIAGEQE